MSESAGPQPAVDGWFTAGEAPRLLGSHCRACGTYAFPPETFACRNPWCGSEEVETVGLSRTGTVWSYTVNHYPPPPPALPADPFEPYGVAAVELAREQMVVLGLVARGVDLATLGVGQAMELVVEPIFAGSEELVWKWRQA